MDNNRLSAPLYFLYAIKRSPYCYNLKWKNIKGMVTAFFGKDILDELKNSRIINTYSDQNAIEIINVNDIKHDLSNDEKEEIFKKFISYSKDNALITGLMNIMYLDRKLAQFFMDLLEQKKNDDEITEAYALFPIINYTDFYYSQSFADFCRPYVDSLKLDMDKFDKYTNNEWFVKLIIILRDGSYNNNSLGKSIENNEDEFIDGIIELMKNDDLATIIENVDAFLNDSRVYKELNRYAYKAIREKKIKKFYYWLAIANDIMVGLEFVIGSIFFLPSESKYSTLGVYLFIIGSSQLLIRPMIQIARTIHIWLLHKKN